MTKAELRRRKIFYRSVFGAKLKNIKKYRPTLWPVELFDSKIADLRKAGFDNPVKMIVSLPPIFSHSFINIKDKIVGLKRLGFKDPVKMISVMPPILGYSVGKIKRKISGLRKLGFDESVGMIESRPSMLGYSLENIRSKARYFRRAFLIIGADFSAVEFIEGMPANISYSQARISLVVRAVYDKKMLLGRSKISQALIEPDKLITPDDLEKYPKLKLRHSAYYGKQ